MIEKLMPRNEHPIERGLRVVLGLGLIGGGLALAGSSWMGVPMAVVGLVPLATGALGSCPLYTLFGFSTCPVR